jgi:addiction module HigA family antidote
MHNATPPAHPGVILLEKAMKPLGVSRNKLARDIDVPVGRISDIVSGKRGISPDTALRLAKYFGTSAEMWMRLQWEYDLYVARVTVWPKIDPRVRVFEPSEDAPHGARGGARPAEEPVIPDLPDPVLPGTGGSVPEPVEALAEPMSEDGEPASEEPLEEPVVIDRVPVAARPRTAHDAAASELATLDVVSSPIDVAERVVPVAPESAPSPAAVAAVAEIARQAAAAVVAAEPAVARAPLSPPTRPAAEPVEVDPEVDPSDFAPEQAPEFEPDLDVEEEVARERDVFVEHARRTEPTPVAPPPWLADPLPATDGDLRIERSAEPQLAADRTEPISDEAAWSGTPAEVAVPTMPAEPEMPQASEPAPVAAEVRATLEERTSEASYDPAEEAYQPPEAPESSEPIELPPSAVFADPGADDAPPAAAGEAETRFENGAVAAPAVVAGAPGSLDPVADPLAPPDADGEPIDAHAPDPLSEAAPLTLVDEVDPPLLDEMDDDEPLLLTEELPSLDIPDPDESRYRVRRGVD